MVKVPDQNKSVHYFCAVVISVFVGGVDNRKEDQRDAQYERRTKKK